MYGNPTQPQMHYPSSDQQQVRQYPPQNPNPIYNPYQHQNTYNPQQLQQQPEQQVQGQFLAYHQPQVQEYQYQYQQNLSPSVSQYQYQQSPYQPTTQYQPTSSANSVYATNPSNTNVSNGFNPLNSHPQQLTSFTTASPSRPPYVDPETHVVYHCSNPEFEGYLTKQSMWLKDWRRRYFILSGSKLFFAKTPYSAPHGMIDLSTATTVKSADLKSKKKNSFEISTHEFTYLMYADSDKEKDDWIGSVGRAIVRSSGTFLKKGVEERGDYGNQDDDNGGYEDGVFENENNHPYFND